MRTYAYATLVYGIIIFVHGIMGIQYTERDAFYTPEIIASVLLVISSILMIKNQMWPHYLALLLSIGLFFLFGYRFYQTTNFMQGVLGGLSAFSVFIHFIKIVHISDIE